MRGTLEVFSSVAVANRNADGVGRFAVKRMADTYKVWATLTGSRGHWDLNEVLPVMRQLIDRPLRLYWPAPYGQPVLLASPDFDPVTSQLYRYRIQSAVFPDVAPELTIAGKPLTSTSLSSFVLDALAERWRKVWWESTQALDQVWNSLWLAVHAGRHEPEDLYELLVQGAETIVQASVICLAVRRTSYHVLEIVQSRGLRNPSVSKPLPLSRGLGGFVAENQEGVVVHDYESSLWRDPRELALIHAEDLHGGMAVPWQAMDGVDGVLYAWFHQSGAPSPLALYAFQRYVRSIRAVVLSAQSASSYSSSASLARYAADPAIQSLLRVLRLARRQGSWDTLLAALADHGVWIQLTDTWGQILRKSPDLPNAEPTRTAALDGLETALLTVWGDMDLIDTIYPHFIQTLALLVHHEATVHDAKTEKLREWLTRLIHVADERSELWEQRRTWGIPQVVNQIWGLQLAQSQALTWSGRAILRAIRRKFETQPIVDGRTIWILTPYVYAVDDVETFRHYLSAQLSQPVSLIGTGSDADVAVVLAAMARIQAALKEATEATTLLGRPEVTQLFRLPGLDTSLKLYIDAWIRPLIRYDAENGTELVSTLAVTLAAPHLAEAARNLFVHPNTIRYRLEQIGELLTPLDLKDPTTRASLMIACEAWRSLEHPTPLTAPVPVGDTAAAALRLGENQ